jgi:hypothetical protein
VCISALVCMYLHVSLLVCFQEKEEVSRPLPFAPITKRCECVCVSLWFSMSLHMCLCLLFKKKKKSPVPYHLRRSLNNVNVDLFVFLVPFCVSMFACCSALLKVSFFLLADTLLVRGRFNCGTNRTLCCD